MKKYLENMKKYVQNMEQAGNTKKFEENMKKYPIILYIDSGTWENSQLSSSEQVLALDRFSTSPLYEETFEKYYEICGEYEKYTKHRWKT